MANKVKFGLRDAHYARIEKYDTEAKKYTYSAVKPFPGAVSLSFDPEGSSDPFYADNGVYYNVQTNSGYSGDFEAAIIPDDFRTEILGEVKNDDGVVIERSDTQGSEFALMFRIEGDKNPRLYIMWRCSAGRPSVESETTEDKTTPKTDTLSITVMPRENDYAVKGYIEKSETNTAVFENWFKQVYEPNAATTGGETA